MAITARLRRPGIDCPKNANQPHTFVVSGEFKECSACGHKSKSTVDEWNQATMSRPTTEQEVKRLHALVALENLSQCLDNALIGWTSHRDLRSIEFWTATLAKIQQLPGVRAQVQRERIQGLNLGNDEIAIDTGREVQVLAIYPPGTGGRRARFPRPDDFDEKYTVGHIFKSVYEAGAALGTFATYLYPLFKRLASLPVRERIVTLKNVDLMLRRDVLELEKLRDAEIEQEFADRRAAEQASVGVTQDESVAIGAGE